MRHISDQTVELNCDRFKFSCKINFIAKSDLFIIINIINSIIVKESYRDDSLLYFIYFFKLIFFRNQISFCFIFISFTFSVEKNISFVSPHNIVFCRLVNFTPKQFSLGFYFTVQVISETRNNNTSLARLIVSS